MTSIEGHRIAPAGVVAENRAFDVTPAALVTAIITEEGVATPPYGAALAALVDRAEGGGGRPGLTPQAR